MYLQKYYSNKLFTYVTELKAAPTRKVKKKFLINNNQDLCATYKKIII